MDTWRERMICTDGLSLSVQPNRAMYGIPRDNVGPLVLEGSV